MTPAAVVQRRAGAEPLSSPARPISCRLWWVFPHSIRLDLIWNERVNGAADRDQRPKSSQTQLSWSSIISILETEIKPKHHLERKNKES